MKATLFVSIAASLTAIVLADGLPEGLDYDTTACPAGTVSGCSDRLCCPSGTSCYWVGFGTGYCYSSLSAPRVNTADLTLPCADKTLVPWTYTLSGSQKYQFCCPKGKFGVQSSKCADEPQKHFPAELRDGSSSSGGSSSGSSAATTSSKTTGSSGSTSTSQSSATSSVNAASGIFKTGSGSFALALAAFLSLAAY